MELCAAGRALCVLCTATAGTPLRAATKYVASGSCSFDVTDGAVVLPSELRLAPRTHIVGRAGVVLHGGLLIDGVDGATVESVTATKRLRVVGATARDTVVLNLTALADDVAVSVAASGTNDVVDVSGSVITGALAPAGVADVSALHATGRLSVVCATGGAATGLLVQHFRAADDALVATGCSTVNLTAVFDAYGSAIMFDIYGRANPPWWSDVARLNWTLTGACVALWLWRRASSAPREPEVNEESKGS